VVVLPSFGFSSVLVESAEGEIHVGEIHRLEYELLTLVLPSLNRNMCGGSPFVKDVGEIHRERR